MSLAECHLSLLDSVVRSTKGFVRVNVDAWGTEGRSVLCVCCIKFITERSTLCMSICFVLLQLIILELQLLCVS